ncbi:hypothetical protein Q9R08_12325 [Microbacterium sp. QXD-8]|uniref:Glycosyltransferase RgtA/B/C/D-like domain-containing protein n=1 Tax=Microbacterium psychrotolerans TaxID=3068321 RepID=A0ABU0Z2F2_9MICO|nr:hypothetical protein [Microbacterium sp. QXD-8]MDQ7878767.1 hypothetical protein [Microbacterium sp. QXD-8]
MKAHRAVGVWASRHQQALFVWASAVILVFLGVSMAVMATDGHAMSFLDEHVHYDTALKMHEGELSHRGALYEEEVVHEWACGVGHQAGGLVHGCGDPLLNVRDVTSGQYTSGYIHYPTYFIVAEMFRAGVDALFGQHFDLSVYRLFSAVLMWLGVALCGVFAFALGIRRWGLVAAVTLPAAATSILVMATMVTPNSTAILAGALVAGTGLLWIKRGRGFIWLALSSVFASCLVVISSLPVGGFILLIFAASIARAAKWEFEGPWQPRLWQGLVLSAIVVAPVIAWGRYIAATATATNAEVYGPYQLQGWRPVIVGAVQELFAFHSPWTDWNMGMPATGGTASMLLRAAAVGVPLWITVVVVGSLVLAIFGIITAARASALVNSTAAAGTRVVPFSKRAPRTFDAHRMLAAGTLLTIILYPAALRVSNALNFGVDFGIVARYSMAFAPLLVLLALLLVRRQAFAIVLAVIGVVGLVATAGVWI